MAPRRPTKRTKVTDTRSSNSSSSSSSNNGDNSPVVVASSPGVVESTAVVATTTVDIKGMLLSLYDTQTEAEGIKNMESLVVTHLFESKANCQELFDLQGISTILSAIRRFKTSVKLVEYALGGLIIMICHLQEAAPNLLIRLDFHETLLSLANMHTNSIVVQTMVAFVFQNMAIGSNPQLKKKLGTEEIILFMRNVMTTFPDEVKIVNFACCYFFQMSNIPELKCRLLENEVPQPLVTAFQKFRKWKDDDIDGDEDMKKRLELLVLYSKQAVTNLLS